MRVYFTERELKEIAIMGLMIIKTTKDEDTRIVWDRIGEKAYNALLEHKDEVTTYE